MPKINRLKDKHTKLQPEYKHEDNSQLYYNTKYWRKLRRAYRMEHPLCEECLEQGIVREAEQIHHKVPFMNGKNETERWNLLLDVQNLQALCSECHHKKHSKQDTDKSVQFFMDEAGEDNHGKQEAKLDGND